jgi:hypothetical protein
MVLFAFPSASRPVPCNCGEPDFLESAPVGCKDAATATALVNAVFNTRPGRADKVGAAIARAAEKHTEGDGLTMEEVVASLEPLGLPVNKCRRYHLQKCWARPPPAAPTVVARGEGSVTLCALTYHPVWDVAARWLEVELDGAVGPVVPVDAGGASSYCRGVSVVEHTLDGLRRGDDADRRDSAPAAPESTRCAHRVRVRWITGDPVFDASLLWSSSIGF